MELNKTKLAQALEVSTTTIDAWLRAGLPYISKPGNGDKGYKFNLASTVGWLMARESGRFDSEALTAQRCRLTKAQADKAERELEALEGTLAPLAEIEKAWSWQIMSARSTLLALPARIAPQAMGLTTHEVESLVRESIHEALHQLAEAPAYDPEWQPAEPELEEIGRLQ